MVDGRYSSGQWLPDQPGADGVLTFAFSSPVDLAWVTCTGGSGRADPFGGVPTSTGGIICLAGVPTPLSVTTSTVKVYAGGGTTVRVHGFRY